MSRLRIIAGIYAGTVEVKKVGDSISSRGSYSEAQYPEALEKTLTDADVNGDSVITRSESSALYRKVLEEETAR